MSERRLTNTVYIMVLATRGFMKKHNMSVQEFLNFDKKYQILNYIAECPDSFDDLPETEMANEIDGFISSRQGVTKCQIKG